MFIQFNNTYAKLPENFYVRLNPVKVKSPRLIHFNLSLANELNLNLINTDDKEIAGVFSGNKILEGSEPIALAYAGHQFGHFVPQLGDGRAILLGEVTDRKGNQRDIQLKGSGQTPYSRRGDGRATLNAMIREYIISEAMYHLGIKTTRCLALVATGEPVYRETILPGAILTRVAASHVRIGTFEYFAKQNDFKSIKILADYAIHRHYPESFSSLNPYKSLLEYVIEAQSSLIIDWIRVGFIHGVMNTDNMTLSGETIDYGPCAFMDEYQSNKVFSSIDYYGRYAFNNQANICLWNLMQLGKSLSFLLDPDPKKAAAILDDLMYYFKSLYESKFLKIMSNKIGIINPTEKDRNLVSELLGTMQEDKLDYTLTFRYLCYAINYTAWPYDAIFNASDGLNKWIKKWHFRLQSQNESIEEASNFMYSLNPAIIPRNYKIEDLIYQSIQNEDDCISQIQTTMEIFSKPYTKQEKHIGYMRSPKPHERICQTFCGT